MKKLLAGLMLVVFCLTANVAQAIDDVVEHCGTTGCGQDLPDGTVRITSEKQGYKFWGFVYHHCWRDGWYDGRFSFTGNPAVVAIDIDYLRLWEHHNGNDYELLKSATPGVVGVGHEGLQKVTTPDTLQPLPLNSEYHTQIRYRIQWPASAGGWGVWKNYNSDDWDHPCAAV